MKRALQRYVRPLVRAVHPDLLTSRPEMAARNAQSLQLLNACVDAAAAGAAPPAPRVALRFHVAGRADVVSCHLELPASRHAPNALRRQLAVLRRTVAPDAEGADGDAAAAAAGGSLSGRRQRAGHGVKKRPRGGSGGVDDGGAYGAAGPVGRAALDDLSTAWLGPEAGSVLGAARGASLLDRQGLASGAVVRLVAGASERCAELSGAAVHSLGAADAADAALAAALADCHAAAAYVASGRLLFCKDCGAGADELERAAAVGGVLGKCAAQKCHRVPPARARLTPSLPPSPPVDVAVEARLRDSGGLWDTIVLVLERRGKYCVDPPGGGGGGGGTTARAPVDFHPDLLAAFIAEAVVPTAEARAGRR